MTDDEKRTFEALDCLRRAAWDSFDKRRPYEWRVCLAIWTALAVFSSLILSGRVSSVSPDVVIGVNFAAVVLVLLHLNWVRGLSRANTLDRRLSFLFRNAMEELVKCKPEGQLETDLKKADARWRLPGIMNWNHLFQIGVTLILAIGAMLTVRPK